MKNLNDFRPSSNIDDGLGDDLDEGMKVFDFLSPGQRDTIRLSTHNKFNASQMIKGGLSLNF